MSEQASEQEQTVIQATSEPSVESIFDDVIKTVVKQASSRSGGAWAYCIDRATILLREKLVEPTFAAEILQRCLNELNDTLLDALKNADFVECEITGDLLRIDDTITINFARSGRRADTATVSNSHNTYSCSDCGQSYLASAPRDFRTFVTPSYEVGSDTVCQDCFEDNYGICEDCNNNVHHDNLRYSEAYSANYCSDCYPNGLEVTANRLRLPAMAESSSSRLAVGWEIEFYPADHASVPSSEHVERIYQDGSLSSEGRELTTQPATPDIWKTRLSALDEALDGGHVGTDCGGHLHVDARYLHKLLWESTVDKARLHNTELVNTMVELREAVARRQDEIAKAMDIPLNKQIHVAVVYYQGILRLLCSERRNSSSYCCPQSYLEISYDKYMSVNLEGLQCRTSRKTVEFRLWDGSIDTNELYRRAEVCEAIVRKLTHVVEQLKSIDEIAKQQANNFLDSKRASDLMATEGFGDLYADGDASYMEVAAAAIELGLSQEWLTWAKAQIAARAPAIPVAA